MKSIETSTARAPKKRAGSFLDARMRASRLIAAVLGLFALDNLLLWRFLDFAPWWLFGAAAAAMLLLFVGARGAIDACYGPGPTVRTLLAAAAVATLLFILGGEGRLLYANSDWQVRDAVLHDMIAYRWPFVYTARGQAEVLRAPLGMYMLPAIVGKGAGLASADVAMLVQNSVLLALLLALAATLYPRLRVRLVALLVFIAFSGMDVVGALWMYFLEGMPLSSHIEPWAHIQFSSHLTQAFWVPHHALAGWCGALFFLLWRDGKLPLVVPLGALPLLALWSPFGAIGAFPFVVHAGFRSLTEGRIHIGDILFPVIACALALPALVYLTVAAATVGVRPYPISPDTYLLFQLIEILPYLGAVTALGLCGRFAGATLAIVAVCLLLFPLVQVGPSSDFMMRASITALAILAVQVADVLTTNESLDRIHYRRWRVALVCILAVGSVTGLLELARSFVYRPVPWTQCTLMRSWDQMADLTHSTKSTYAAPVSALPYWMRPVAPQIVTSADDPPQCWPRPWKVRRLMYDGG